MKMEGPNLDRLLHRLAECPAEFMLLDQGVEVAAIVCDVIRRLPNQDAPEMQTMEFALIRRRPVAAQKLISLAAWMLADESLQQLENAIGLWEVFTSDQWEPLAKLVRPEKFVSDPDRREEFARLCLAMLKLQPPGETVAQFEDRLATLNSAARDRILRATAASERRAREVREAMARQKALESTSRFGE